jgi:hypothetical protein
LATLDDIGKKFSDFNPAGDKGIQGILQNWGNEVIAKFRANLQKNKSLASRRLYSEIDSEILPTKTGFSLQIKMLDYYKWVEDGRPPTRTNTPSNPTLQKSIEQWIINKGIQTRTSKNQSRAESVKSLAYVIARKIHRKGTKARPFISPVLTDKMKQTLVDRVGKYIADSLAS